MNRVSNSTITKELVARQYPQIANYFREEGIQQAVLEERERYCTLMAMSQPGFEDVIQAAIDNGDAPGAVAMKIIAAMPAQKIAASWDVAIEKAQRERGEA